MSAKIKITGDNCRVVNEVQSRLDKFFKCTKTYETARKALDELGAQNVELANLPAYQDRYQTRLSQYKEAAEGLKAAAEKIEKKTDEEHLRKYCKLRENQFRTFALKQPFYRYIHLDYEEYLEGIHEAAKQIIAIDFEAEVAQAQNESQRKKTEALSEIEFVSIDQTFPRCRDRLMQENPDEYLRQAALYQHKLLETNNEMEVLAFGNLWMKNLPKEATWQQVENMSFIMSQAAEKNGNVDLTEYRAAVQQWLKEHPLSENPDSVDLTPDQATTPLGRRIYVLGLLYSCGQKLDMSPEAFQIYQSCSALYPDQHSWKVAQAVYHINHLQWVEAKQSLADLPKDHPSVRDTQRELDYYLRERISLAVMDVGLMALFNYIFSAYRETATFDIAQTGLHLFTSGPVRQMWVPRALGIPERAISYNPYHLPLGSSIPMLGDVVDCAFRNIAFLRPYQRHESFVSCTLRTANTFRILSEPLQRSIPSMVNLGANLGSQFISAIQSYDACQENRRCATWQAFSSTFQLTASDLTTTITIASYGDLLPLIPLVGSRLSQIASSIGVTSLAAWIFSDPSAETEGSSRDKWLIAAAGIGSLVAIRLYRDYPYLWAASVMRDVEFYSSQGDRKRVEDVLSEAEKSYFVARTRADIREFEKYLDSLQNYQTSSGDPEKYTKLQENFPLILKVLKKSDHYRGVLLSLLIKKAEIALQKQDLVGLADAIKEDYKSKVTECSFQTLLNLTYHLALKNPTAACSYLTKMSPAFSPYLNPKAEALDNLLEKHVQYLQEWAQQSLPALIENPPSPQKAEAWNRVFQALQDFFSENVGKLAVYQDLQYFRLALSVSQSNTEQTEALFKGSEKEVHLRFSRELIQQTKILRKNRKYQEVTGLLKRARFNSFKDNKLIQDYGDFFSLLFSSPLQRDAVLKEMQKLEICITSLNTKDECHQELLVFFESCRIVLSLDAGEYTNARKLLAQETTDLRVPNEVAAFLFERLRVSMQENGPEIGLSDLESIIENLRSWQHLELFKAYHAYLVCEPSFEAQLERVTALVTRMTPIEQLSDFAFNLQYLQEFELQLSQEKFEEAKSLLSAPVPRELYSRLCNILFMYFIHRREQQRQTVPLREVTKTLQSLNTLFASPNSDMIQSYVNFLVLLDNIEGEKDIAAHQEALQSLKTVFEKLNAVRCPAPGSLKEEVIDILLEIVRLADEAGQREIGLEAIESIKEVVIPDEQLEYFIRDLQRQLNA